MSTNVTIIGRLTADIELKEAGKSVVSNFTLASKDFKGKKIIETDFINCTAWEEVANLLAKYTTKGVLLCAHGKLKVNNSTSEDGKKYRNSYVLVDSVEILSSKQKEAEAELTF
ncbi:MAG: single-stranded DNA-binding protein [Erysipelotrichaceae bacterium]